MGVVQRNGWVSETLTQSSLLRGRGGKSLDRVVRICKFGNSASSVPRCVATRLRAGAVACAVLSAVIEATHKLR
jgi:hypothetical protein